VSVSGGRIPIEPAQLRWWLSDPVAWAIFATGIIAMSAAFVVITVFENIAAISERRGLFRLMFFAASAFALAGPLAATIGQLFPSHAGTTWGKKDKGIGLDDI
jgi:hypothetical protein